MRLKRATTRATRLARGLCIDCGEVPHHPDRVRCRPCGARNSARTSAAFKRRKVARVVAAHVARREAWRAARRAVA